MVSVYGTNAVCYFIVMFYHAVSSYVSIFLEVIYRYIEVCGKRMGGRDKGDTLRYLYVYNTGN